MCGLPQGSSLSLLLFHICLQPLIEVLAQLDCWIFNYADDTQLVLQIDNSVKAQQNVQNILCLTVNWMTGNSLKINPEKTEVTGRVDPWSNLFWPSELDVAPTPTTSVKSLGINLDKDLSMSKQVASVCGVCTFLLGDFGSCPPYLLKRPCAQWNQLLYCHGMTTETHYTWDCLAS